MTRRAGNPKRGRRFPANYLAEAKASLGGIGGGRLAAALQLDGAAAFSFGGTAGLFFPANILTSLGARAGMDPGDAGQEKEKEDKFHDSYYCARNGSVNGRPGVSWLFLKRRRPHPAFSILHRGRRAGSNRRGFGVPVGWPVRQTARLARIDWRRFWRWRD